MISSTGLGCTWIAIKTDVPLQLWHSITTFYSAGMPSWAVRMFHNKGVYYPINAAQCYTHYWSPKFLVNNFGLWQTLVLFVTIWFIIRYVKPLKKPLYVAMALYPLVLIFELYR